jgi:hypothetical protein
VEGVFTLKLESDLRDTFLADAATTHRSASQLVREFMRNLSRISARPGSMTCGFRSQIQAALDDPRPGTPPEVVMAEARAIIDRVAAWKKA